MDAGGAKPGEGPRSVTPGFWVETDAADIGADPECAKLHEADELHCHACGHTVMGRAFAARLQKKRNLVPCPVVTGLWGVHRGATRLVLLVGGWAVKVPSPRSWELFLWGLLGNMQERTFSRCGWPELCPVLFSIPGGWALIMRRARPLTDGEWEVLDPAVWADRGTHRIPVEGKRSSFGVLDGRVVAVDYGS